MCPYLRRGHFLRPYFVFRNVLRIWLSFTKTRVTVNLSLRGSEVLSGVTRMTGLVPTAVKSRDPGKPRDFAQWTHGTHAVDESHGQAPQKMLTPLYTAFCGELNPKSRFPYGNMCRTTTLRVKQHYIKVAPFMKCFGYFIYRTSTTWSDKTSQLEQNTHFVLISVSITSLTIGIWSSTLGKHGAGSWEHICVASRSNGP